MYFPKSQIKSNLYTNGGEYITSTTKIEYIGYYYETSSGQKYTGKTPQDGSNISLLKINKLNDNITLPNHTLDSDIFITINNSIEANYPSILNLTAYPGRKDFVNRTLPFPNPTQPTSKDQSLGVFTRYFCKKNNELKYMEIDQTTYTKLFTQENTIAWDLYSPEKTLWYIKGDKEQIYKANKGLISLIEQQQKWYGFTQFFQDKFLKYYLDS